MNHDEQKIIIQLSNEISEEILFNDLLQPNQKNPNQMMVYFLRSLAAHGLSHKAFDLVIGQKDYLETFKLTQDSLENERLLAKNMDQPSDSHGYIEIAFDDSKINQAHWKLFSILSPCKNPQDQKEHAKKMKGLEKAEKKERKKKEREEKREQKAQAREAKMAKREDPSSRDFSKVIDSFGKFGTYAIALLLAMVLAYSTSQIEFEIGDWRGAIENILESSSDDSDTSDSNQRRIIKGYKTPKNPFTRSNRSLSDLVNRNNESDIDSIFDIGSEIKKLFAPRPKIEHFDVNPIENPQARQLSQLTLIRNYFEITTGYPVTNDLFIYDGKGTKGVNFGGSSIAMHQALFDVGFYEMLSVFSHEVAHNLVPNHGPDFAHAEEAIFHAMIDRIDDIALKAINGEPVTEAEKYLVHAPSEWERLKTLKE